MKFWECEYAQFYQFICSDSSPKAKAASGSSDAEDAAKSSSPKKKTSRSKKPSESKEKGEGSDEVASDYDGTDDEKRLKRRRSKKKLVWSFDTWNVPVTQQCQKLGIIS